MPPWQQSCIHLRLFSTQWEGGLKSDACLIPGGLQGPLGHPEPGASTHRGMVESRQRITGQLDNKTSTCF